MKMTAIDGRILEVIDELRAEFSACTARAVARRMRMSNNIIRDRCIKLRDENLVTWNSMDGSLRRIHQPGVEFYNTLLANDVPLDVANELAWPQLVLHEGAAQTPRRAYMVVVVPALEMKLTSDGLMVQSGTSGRRDEAVVTSTGAEIPPVADVSPNQETGGTTVVKTPARKRPAKKSTGKRRPSAPRAAKRPGRAAASARGTSRAAPVSNPAPLAGAAPPATA